MGAKCFCGCGRRIPLRKLVLRSHNNRGHDVVKSIARVRNGLAEKGREPDAGERDRATTSDSPHARRLHHAVRALAQASEEAQRAEVLLRLDLPSASEAVHLRERVSHVRSALQQVEELLDVAEIDHDLDAELWGLNNERGGEEE